MDLCLDLKRVDLYLGGRGSLQNFFYHLLISMGNGYKSLYSLGTPG